MPVGEGEEGGYSAAATDVRAGAGAMQMRVRQEKDTDEPSGELVEGGRTG